MFGLNPQSCPELTRILRYFGITKFSVYCLTINVCGQIVMGSPIQQVCSPYQVIVFHREGDYDEFLCHLQGLCDLYQLSRDT